MAKPDRAARSPLPQARDTSLYMIMVEGKTLATETGPCVDLKPHSPHEWSPIQNGDLAPVALTFCSGLDYRNNAREIIPRDWTNFSELRESLNGALESASKCWLSQGFELLDEDSNRLVFQRKWASIDLIKAANGSATER